MRRLVTFIAIVLLLSTPAFAYDLDDLSIPDTHTMQDQQLALNGAGFRSKYFVKLYAAALYLSSASTNAKEIQDADQAMAITLTLVSSAVTNEKMISALNKGFKKSLGKKLKSVQAEVKQLGALFSEPLSPNDVVAFEYNPGSGISVLKNGTELGLIPGLLFKQGLFGIWLADSPAQKSLKEELLSF